MSVKDYEARFSQLYRFFWPMDAEKLARRFEQGLNYEIRERVIILRLPTMAMILDRAMATERELQASRKESSIVGDFRGKGKAIAEGSNAPDVPLRCFNCNELGHVARKCVKPKCRKCYKCGQKGHVVRECTQPKVMREMTHQQAPARAAAAPVRIAPVGQVANHKCFNCNEMGHVGRACTKQKNLVCFTCGQTGHFSRDCTQQQGRGQGNQQRQLPQGQARVFAIGQQNAEEEDTVVVTGFWTLV
ncbi:cold shock protein 1-like [Rosa chinensis]|uniref:cold shock protein 1-like n=1 Tax=Rosa chinensis TaxID=74649 RepID=UPI000D09224A|nr:cold shock protein 1-like [Rosa chinensis]